ncbi:gem-associated protein 5-like isoform X1 [Vespula squamosa]|uniref:Gem-associated protein 5-like isoform X1 n=1 Tax=Vespula squamosa TaxID=30214 RepID=A0ABD2C1Z1_VESSQ
MVIIYLKLKKILETKIEESIIYTWLKGEFENGMLQILKIIMKNIKLIMMICVNIASLWINFSGQLAIPIICNTVEKQLIHLINALSIISQFKILHRKNIVNHENSFIAIFINMDSKSPIENKKAQIVSNLGKTQKRDKNTINKDDIPLLKKLDREHYN